MSTERDLELIYELGCLRFIQRAWKQIYGPNFANLAEHHLRICWLALLLAKQEGITNTEKVLKMALVHDVAESRTGDVHYISRLYTKRDEHSAIKDILKDTALEEEFIKLWEEYEARTSPEAKVVKDADNLDVDLELQEQAAIGSGLKKAWAEHRSEGMYKTLYTESAKKLWHAIQDSNPNDWHIHAKNRFTAGDWKPQN